MALLDGQSLLERAAVMLPDHLYRSNEDKLPLSTHRYTSLSDVLDFVDTRKPDLVFFVSAYGLLGANYRPLPLLKQIVSRFRERGCRLVTTDPILGMSPKLRMSQVDLPLSRLNWRSRFQESRNLRRLFKGFSEIGRMFHDVTHLYPVPVDGLSTVDGVPRVSFFNERMIRSMAEPTQEPSWLFVIGGSDLKCQLILWGADRFAGLVQRWLEQARRESRRPVLIAPRSLVDNLSHRLSPAIGAELIPLCSYAEFISRLFDAEYAFYWNTFSCSILLRLSNGLPVFFFDPGHVARLLRPSYEAGIRCYYGGAGPNLLDARKPLDIAALRDDAARQRCEMPSILARLRRSPPPEVLIDGLLREPPGDLRG